MDVQSSVEILKSGGLVALPTETVYGLAARYDNPKAVASIFSTKGRPSFDPLILHISHLKQARELVSLWPDLAQTLAEHFWPGPLTLVLPKSEKVNSAITAGLPNVAIRWPKHPLFLEVLEKLGTALAAPSANRFGKTSPTKAQDVLDEFQGDVPVLDGGPCEIGLESTVVAIEADEVIVLRPGAITTEMLAEVTKKTVHSQTREDSPGHLKVHYQPKAPLYLTPNSNLPELVLNPNPSLAARELYGLFRQFSEAHPSGFYINPEKYPQDGLWTAIWDRVKRAATTFTRQA